MLLHFIALTSHFLMLRIVSMLGMSEIIIEWFLENEKKIIAMFFSKVFFLIYQCTQSFVDEERSKITTKCVCEDATVSYMKMQLMLVSHKTIIIIIWKYLFSKYSYATD